MKFGENDEIHVKLRKSVKSAPKWKRALFAPKAEIVALAQGILGVLGIQNTKIVKITKFSEI